MNKLPASDVNAQMGYAAASGLEEYQISGLQAGLGNQGSHGPLLFAGSGECDSVGFEHILHKS